jgi:hypothetical protein
LIKQGEDNDEDLNFFRSIVPYKKQLPPTKKVIFENRVADEISALHNNLLHSSASSSALSFQF